MLEQFTWGEFLLAMALLNLIWYGLVMVVFYRREVLFFLGGGGKGSALTPAPKYNPDDSKVSGSVGGKVESAKQGTADGIDEGGLMGKSRLPVGVEVLSSAQVVFAESEEGGKYSKVGLVADVVQELKLIFSELENKAGNKGDFFRMLERLKEDYGQIGGHPNIGAINEFIRNAAPFHLTKQEIDNLWY